MELARLYDLTLDALASAESATLSDIDLANSRRQTASHAAIAGFVDDARQHVGSLTQLFLHAAETQQLTERADSPMTNSELSERIRTQLAQVMARADRDSPT